MADCEFVVMWTAVLYDTAISAHPQRSQPRVLGDGWVHYTPDANTSKIWIPAERRSLYFKAVAATESRLMVGDSNGAMTMIYLTQ
jgi:hypothetical protein